MIASISKSVPCGRVLAPSSKSMTHRLLICAALRGGKCRIDNVAFSQDVLATIDCLKALGVKIEEGMDYLLIDADNFMKEAKDMDARESGSTLRFFIPLLMCLKKDVRIYGSKRLLERPQDVYEELSQRENFTFERHDDHILINGSLKGGDYFLRGDISSQFITGLLFGLCFLGESFTVEVLEPFESRSYVDLTVAALNTFGFKLSFTGNTLKFMGKELSAKDSYTVEADESNAAFLDCYEKVEVLGRNPLTLQGDRVFEVHFKVLREGYADIDLQDCPDLAPVLMAMAALYHGAHFLNTRRLSIKECDRGRAMKEELEKLGGDVEVYDNDIYVKSKPLSFYDGVLSGHNDHRIVMALTYVLSFVSGCIDEAQAVSKSFPAFFKEMKDLGLEVELYDC